MSPLRHRQVVPFLEHAAQRKFVFFLRYGAAFIIVNLLRLHNEGLPCQCSSLMQLVHSYEGHLLLLPIKTSILLMKKQVSQCEYEPIPDLTALVPGINSGAKSYQTRFEDYAMYGVQQHGSMYVDLCSM